MPKKICKPRNGRGKVLVVWGGNRCGKTALFERLQKAFELERVHGRKIGRSVVEKWKRRMAEGCVIKPKEEPKPTNWWERVGQLDELVPCAICGKRIDPDTAVASGYNGDLCCSEHFSKDVVEVEQQTESVDLQDRLALAENRVENLTRSLKNAKRKTREKAAKLEACREQINAL